MSAGEFKRDGFTSSVPYVQTPMAAAVVYCSDGRFVEHVEEFLQSALNLKRYDRLVVPGGAACLAGNSTTGRNQADLTEQLAFLIHAHELRRVVLVAHEDCGHYIHGLGIPLPAIEKRQFDDLAEAASRVRGMASDVRADCYFARCNGDTIRFEQVGA